jgi:SAM-dependent methyltransferase
MYPESRVLPRSVVRSSVTSVAGKVLAVIVLGTLSDMPEWWENFFESLWQEVQLGMFTEEDDRAAVDKIESAMDLREPVRILDVPCGGGRVSLELAARGHDVTGVDLNGPFLDEAKRQAAERGLSVRWMQRDMRDLPFESEFDVALNVGGSFGYFDEHDNTRVAAAACRALRPRGRLSIDMPTPETLFPRFRERLWLTAHEVLVLSENRYDHEAGRIDTDWTIVAPGGRREKRHSSIRLYTYRELVALLRAVGFESVQGFDADSLEPFAIGAPRLMLVATKGG